MDMFYITTECADMYNSKRYCVWNSVQ